MYEKHDFRTLKESKDIFTDVFESKKTLINLRNQKEEIEKKIADEEAVLAKATELGINVEGLEDEVHEQDIKDGAIEKPKSEPEEE